MSNEILGDRGRALEELFFARESEKFHQARQEKDVAESRKAALSAASGINDDTVLDRLIALNITSDTLAALTLVPLVEVAWADGEMDEREGKAILSAAADSGLSAESAALLDTWLVIQPGSSILAAWKAYVSALTGNMDAVTRDNLKQELLCRARVVAESAGGILGIGKISKEEENKLEELAEVFSQG